MSPQPPMGNGIDDRRTPRDLFDRRNAVHHFTLDAAASYENTLVPSHYCTINGTFVVGLDKPISEDGLSHSWAHSVVFFNPPYSQPEQPCRLHCQKKRCLVRGHLMRYSAGTEDFVAKAWLETRTGCPLAEGLLPVRTEQPWFHRFVYDIERGCWRPGVSVEFIPGRLKYDGLATGAPFPSMLVTWRPPPPQT